MPASSPILNLPLPAGSDAPDGPGDFLRFATDAEKYLVGQFASGAARDAAIPSGQRRAGMIAAIGSGASQQVTIHNGTAWTVLWDPLSTQALTSLWSAGSPQYSPAAIRQGGWVQIDGGVTRAANASPSTPEIATDTYTTICTLPVGYRPAKYQYYPVSLPGSTAACGLRVQTSGAVEVLFASGASTAVVAPLTGIRFRAA